MLIGIETSTAELQLLKVTPEQLEADVRGLIRELLLSKGLNPHGNALQVSAQVIPSREEFVAALRGANLK